MHPTTPELDAALDAARRAAAVVLAVYADFPAVTDPPAGITTEADRQAQETVLQALLARFPGDAYLAEEATPTAAGLPRTGPRQWVIDPIDGTRGFAQKSGEFSVMVAFVRDGRVEVGVVHEPALSRVTYALHGHGCWRCDGPDAAPEPCRVTTVDDLAAATLAQSHPRDPNKPTREARALRPARVRVTHSAGVKLALVARGDADLYVNRYPKFNDWDIAAGNILVEEAGGTVTGVAGQPLVFGTPDGKQTLGLLASNGRLHAEAVARLAAG